MTTEASAYSAVPQSLHTYEQWICWESQQRNGKATKVPVDPETGEFASATDPDTWTDFETARTACDQASGIGFVFTADDPIIGVDLDDCRDPDTGAPADWARAVVDRLGSYTEVSPSGTGYHILVRGSLPGERNRSGDIEIYDDARFFTVSGDHVAGTPTEIKSREEALTAVYDEHLRQDALEQQTTSPATRDPSGHLDDESLLAKAKNATNGDQFTALWNGHTTGYDSHSEADMALCCHLAFWTGGDRSQMDRLFRQSGLMREKWDERHYADGSTYGEKTIERAIAVTDEFYEPPDSDADSSATVVSPTDQTTSAEAATVEQIEELRATVSHLEARIDRLEAELDRLSNAVVIASDRPDTETTAPPAQNEEDSRDTVSDGWRSRFRNVWGDR